MVLWSSSNSRSIIFLIRLRVTYWPSTEPSNKRCTCVNKQTNSGNRCIRSKISEYHLDLRTWLNSVQMRTPTWSRWVSNNYITKCHGRIGSVGVWVAIPVGYKMPGWEPTPDRGLRPSVTPCWAAQPECERSASMVRRTWGQYVAVCPRLQLTSHTQPASTLSQPFRNPFENKVWEVYFYKEMCSFVPLKSTLCFWLHLHVHEYTTYVSRSSGRLSKEFTM